MTRPSQARTRLWSVDGAERRRRTDYLAVEEPLEIQLRAGRDRRTAAITMRTPGHDYELAAGFLYNEGVIAYKEHVAQMIYCVDQAPGAALSDQAPDQSSEPVRQQYNVLAVNLRLERLPQLPNLDRYFFTTSACGVCGATMLDDLAARRLPALDPAFQVDDVLLTALPDRLRAAQHLFAHTGGLHAAAVFDSAGELLVLREDVGRHNAMDKVVGWSLMNGHLPFHDKIVLVSGRASYELLYKCRIAGAPIFCAVSAPSSLAVDLARRFGITLVGFLRDGRFNIYAGPERIRRTGDAASMAPEPVADSPTLLSRS